MSEKCPVCKTECNEGAVKCQACGFADDLGINRTFLNPEDLNNWLETVVKPYKANYAEALSNGWVKNAVPGQEAPVNIAEIYAVINGAQKGPFGQKEITAMIEKGELRADTVIWQEGMDEWAPASTVPEVVKLIKAAAEKKAEIEKAKAAEQKAKAEKEAAERKKQEEAKAAEQKAKAAKQAEIDKAKAEERKAQAEKDAIINEAKRKAQAEADKIIASARASAAQIKAQQPQVRQQQPTSQKKPTSKKKIVIGTIIFIVAGTLLMILWAWFIENFL